LKALRTFVATTPVRRLTLTEFKTLVREQFFMLLLIKREH